MSNGNNHQAVAELDEFIREIWAPAARAAHDRGLSMSQYLEVLTKAANHASTHATAVICQTARTKQFNFRCSPEVHHAIHWLSRKAGMSAADYLEMIILTEVDQQYGEEVA